MLRTVHCCKLPVAAHGPILVNICATDTSQPFAATVKKKWSMGRNFTVFCGLNCTSSTLVLAQLEADSKIIGYIDNLIMNWRNPNIPKVIRRSGKIQCTLPTF